jgi:hypothetical protein
LYPFGCFPSDSLIVFGMMPSVFSIRAMAAGVIALPLDHVSQRPIDEVDKIGDKLGSRDAISGLAALLQPAVEHAENVAKQHHTAGPLVLLGTVR